MPFIRVRGASPGDPLHEFDAPVRTVQRSPHLYRVIDPEPVAEARPARHVSGRVRPKRTSRGKRAAGPPAPSGADS